MASSDCRSKFEEWFKVQFDGLKFSEEEKERIKSGFLSGWDCGIECALDILKSNHPSVFGR